MNSESAWTPFEHALWRKMKPFQGSHFLLAISGGKDSMALLGSILRLKIFDSSVLHCHHGPTPDAVQNQYRARAAELVKSFCEENKIRFYQETSKQELKSESELRAFRKASLVKIKKQISADFVVLAHHQDDYLETQMLKLIRGTGFNSPVMSENFNQELRPFLTVSSLEIANYVTEQKLPFLNDPSNQNSDYLRNWLRNSWLPQLEDKCPGALNSISRSLLLLQEVDKTLPSTLWLDNQSISRPIFLTLDQNAQKRALAQFIHQLGVKEFTQNHIFEVLKHLDKTQVEHSFICAKMTWSCDLDSITARPLSS